MAVSQRPINLCSFVSCRHWQAGSNMAGNNQSRSSGLCPGQVSPSTAPTTSCRGGPSRLRIQDSRRAAVELKKNSSCVRLAGLPRRAVSSNDIHDGSIAKGTGTGRRQGSLMGERPGSRWSSGAARQGAGSCILAAPALSLQLATQDRQRPQASASLCWSQQCRNSELASFFCGTTTSSAELGQRAVVCHQTSEPEYKMPCHSRCC